MMYWVVIITAFLASSLSLISGFGLGTILLPAFALFFPLEIAITMTALVHLTNNIFKLFLVRNKIDKNTLLRFAPTAIFAAFIGAWVLTSLNDMPVLVTFSVLDRAFEITPISIVVGVLLIGFAIFELLPRFKKMQFDKKYLPIGGLLSGFFGGLSGHQGAMRSAFLSKTGLDKNTFISTAIVISLFIDITRLSIYGNHILNTELVDNWRLIMAGMLAAFLGAFIASRFIKKITFRHIQLIVGIMLIVMGILIGVGVI